MTSVAGSIREVWCFTGSYDHFLNFQITFIIFLQLAMCIFCAVASYIWRKYSGYSRYQLAMDAYVEGNYQNGLAYTLILLITFWILYSYLVPISLFVTLEIVKFWQVGCAVIQKICWKYFYMHAFDLHEKALDSLQASSGKKQIWHTVPS